MTVKLLTSQLVVTFCLLVAGCGQFQSEPQSEKPPVDPRTLLNHIKVVGKAKTKEQVKIAYKPVLDLTRAKLNREEELFVGRRSGNVFLADGTTDAYEVIYRKDHTYSMLLRDSKDEIEWPSHGVWAIKGRELFMVELITSTHFHDVDKRVHRMHVNDSASVLTFEMDSAELSRKWVFTMKAFVDADGEQVPENKNIEVALPGLLETKFMRPFNQPAALEGFNLLQLIETLPMPEQEAAE